MHARSPSVRGLAIALLMLTAGCVTVSQDEVTTAVDEVDWDAVGAGLYAPHDHRDPRAHEAVSVNAERVAWRTLAPDGGVLGAYGEADVANGLVAVTAFRSGGAVFALLDADALPEVRVLSVTDDPGAYGDVKLDPDRPLLYHAHPGPALAFTIWDVSDPTAPVRVGEAEGAGFGCHMVHPQTLNGEPHVWCAAINGPTLYRVHALPDGSFKGVPTGVGLLQGDPETTRYLDYYNDLTPLGPAVALMAHDMTATTDPLDGVTPLAAVARELHGIRVFDVTNPVMPVEVGAWRGEGLDGEMHRVHTVVLTEVGGKRVALASTETYWNAPPQVYVVDFTDWANPELLAVWTPPGIPDDGGGGGEFSAHNLQVVGERLYMANFHGGLWVVDVADPADPRTLALRAPANWYDENGDLIEPASPYIGFWDVIVVNGYALATDMVGGLEVVAVDGDPHGDAGWTSTA